MAPPRFQVIVNAASGRDGVSANLSTTPAPVSWRLLGSNHRELGRSADLFPDIDHCLQAIRDLREAVPNVESHVIAHASATSWFWRIQLGPSVVAISSRLYQRRRESAQSLLRTLESIPLVDREPVILRLRNETFRESRRAPTNRLRTSKILDVRDQARASVAKLTPNTTNVV